MRILLISFWFPPVNAIGAVRTGKFAKYMHEAGHDIRVLAGPLTDKLTLPMELPADRVFRPRVPPRRQPQPASAPPQRGTAVRSPTITQPRPLMTALKRHYYALRHLPDRQSAWGPPALQAARQLMRQWRPHLILASAPPHTSFRVARRLSREADVPWFAELRDPWANDPYNPPPLWRQWFDLLLEHATLRSAAALVTVSPIVAQDLQTRYPGKLVINVFNGYAPEDTPAIPPQRPLDRLTIVYTGSIYVGQRDPSPLFAAIAQLGDRRHSVQVRFHGPAEAEILPLAERFGVQDQVIVGPSLPYRDSLAAQANAGALLLMQRNHPTDAGNIPAKLFEYLAARRPILLLGYEHGFVAGMIRDRQAGFVGNSPEAIAHQLSQWIDQLPAGIPPLPPEACAGLERATQFARYEAFLRAQFSQA